MTNLVHGFKPQQSPFTEAESARLTELHDEIQAINSAAAERIAAQGQLDDWETMLVDALYQKACELNLNHARLVDFLATAEHQRFASRLADASEVVIEALKAMIAYPEVTGKTVESDPPEQGLVPWYRAAKEAGIIR